MRKILPILFFLVSSISFFAQSNKDIANVYIKRAWEKYNDIETRVDALEDFNKAMKYLDSVTTKDVAKLGTFIHYEVGNWQKAKDYSEQYFNLSKNKKSEEYLNLVELFVSIEEELEAQKEQERLAEEKRIRKEKELRKIDSLKTIWNAKSKSLSIKTDSIYNFNANKYALFKLNGKFGVINDRAEIVVEANEYVSALNFDGFFILKNKESNPTKLFSFNTITGVGYALPMPSEFNTISTHFGQVMLPRANGRLVTYPNNSFKPMVYDLNQKKFVRVANEKEVLKSLKKNDRIRRYNNDGEVKIEREWYSFGGHLGGGVHPLYFEKNYKVHAFLFAVDGKVLTTKSSFDYIGAFNENKLQALKGNKTSWINRNGTIVNDTKGKYEKYEGNSRVVKVEDGLYQIQENGIIIKGNESLEKLLDYLSKNE